MIQEQVYKPHRGWLFLLMGLLALIGGPANLVRFGLSREAVGIPASGATVAGLIVLTIVLVVTGLLLLIGLIAVQPNEARVLLLFGEYKGTVKESGFYWVNPFFSKKKISQRIRNFETGSQMISETKDAAGKVTQPKGHSAGKPSKVNDRDGNPIDISAVVVWRVIDTAEAMFEVDDFEDFVRVQSEAALRNLATRHPYDSEDHETSLRGNSDEVCHQLQDDIQERLQKAGVEVIEARISHLAYSPEIAAAMLQRQQAGAVVAARTKIVEGAVGMVELALHKLKKDGIVDLDDERRAAMVSNLLVVLCGDRHTQPVVNAGSLY